MTPEQNVIPSDREQPSAASTRGESAFRVLSYYFELEWDWPGIGDYVRHVLGHFEVPPDPGEKRSPPTPGLPVRYRLVDEGSDAKDRYALFYGEALQIRTERLADVLFHFLWHVNSEAVRHTGDFLLIHAGAVRAPNGVGIVLPGPSGAGKTTLVAALVRDGFDYLSEEAAAIDPVERHVYPYPRVLTIKRAITEILPDIVVPPVAAGWLNGQVQLRPEDLRPGSLADPCPVRLIIAPRYVKDARLEITPISSAEAFMELGKNAMNLAVYRRRALPVLADVVRGSRSYRLVAGDLKDAVRAVREAAEAIDPA